MSGAKTLLQACFAQPGETWHFYEIDPAVLELSRNATFTFVQEYRASRAIEALLGLVPETAAVLRDGERRSVEDVVAQVKAATHGGVEYAIEAASSVDALDMAYRITRRGGTTVTCSLPPPSHTFNVPAVNLVAEERTLKGSYLGSCVPSRDIPRYIEWYRAGILPVNRLLSERIRLDEINGARDATKSSTYRLEAFRAPIVSALHARHATGRGQMVDTSLMEAAIQQTYWQSAIYLATGENPGPSGSALTPYLNGEVIRIDGALRMPPR